MPSWLMRLDVSCSDVGSWPSSVVGHRHERLASFLLPFAAHDPSPPPLMKRFHGAVDHRIAFVHVWTHPITDCDYDSFFIVHCSSLIIDILHFTSHHINLDAPSAHIPSSTHSHFLHLFVYSPTHLLVYPTSDSLLGCSLSL